MPLLCCGMGTSTGPVAFIAERYRVFLGLSIAVPTVMGCTALSVGGTKSLPELVAAEGPKGDGNCSSEHSKAMSQNGFEQVLQTFKHCGAHASVACLKHQMTPAHGTWASM